MSDKTGKTTHRLEQDNPSFGTHPYRGRAAHGYTASVFMHPMGVNLGFELEHQLILATGPCPGTGQGSSCSPKGQDGGGSIYLEGVGLDGLQLDLLTRG